MATSSWRHGFVGVFALLIGCAASTQPPPVHVLPAPPPKDDGKPAEGGSGGTAHAAALEQLRTAPLGARDDNQGSLRIFLPDAEHWTRVKFWGVPSLVGFRYGKDHHAIVAAFVTHADDNEGSGACTKNFESWATPWVEAFDVDIAREAPAAIMWNRKVVDVDRIFAKTATLASHEGYAAAYGAFPAWKNACVIVGIAVPARDEAERARAVRERFASEVLPRVEVISPTEPNDRF